MVAPEQATASAPARRRPNWSLRTIVENVSGHPIAHFQDPPRSPVSAPVAVVAPATGRSASGAGGSEEGEASLDPVDTIYPPLIGPIGRAYHGTEQEHHSETIARHRSEPGSATSARRATGPLARPERIYLHYLLLHMDRLSDTALDYLGHAAEEERAHRAKARPLPPGT